MVALFTEDTMNIDNSELHSERKERLLQTLLILLGFILASLDGLVPKASDLDLYYNFFIFIFFSTTILYYANNIYFVQIKGTKEMLSLLIASSFSFLILAFFVMRSNLEIDNRYLSAFQLCVAFGILLALWDIGNKQNNDSDNKIFSITIENMGNNLYVFSNKVYSYSLIIYGWIIFFTSLYYGLLFMKAFHLLN